MTRISHILTALFLAGALVGCASSSDIFPSVPLSPSAANFELPNPIALAADTARGQLVVANSNVDFLFDHGSLVTLSVDATDATAVKLAVTDAIEIPNFAGQMVFDGTLATIPFREADTTDPTRDQIIQYTVGAGTVAEVTSGTLANDPFGLIANGTGFLAVSDNALSFLASDLSVTSTVDLTAATTAGILDAKSAGAEDVAIDTATGRAFVSNRSGKMFVVDMTSREVTHVLSGSTNTRAVLADSGLIYVLDGTPTQLWVLDPSRLPAATSTPAEVPLATLAVTQIALGLNPNNLLLDTAQNRLFVANTSGLSVSVIDTQLMTEVARLSFKKEDTGLAADGEEPFGMTLGTYNGTSFLFVANLKTDNIFIFNAQTLKLVGTYP